MSDNLRPLRSGDLEAQAVVRLSFSLKRMVEADAARIGISTSEWWRRAARAALGLELAATLGRREGER